MNKQQIRAPRYNCHGINVHVAQKVGRTTYRTNPAVFHSCLQEAKTNSVEWFDTVRDKVNSKSPRASSCSRQEDAGNLEILLRTPRWLHVLWPGHVFPVRSRSGMCPTAASAFWAGGEEENLLSLVLPMVGCCWLFLRWVVWDFCGYPSNCSLSVGFKHTGHSPLTSLVNKMFPSAEKA